MNTQAHTQDLHHRRALAGLITSIQDDELFTPLDGADAKSVFVSSAFTPFVLAVAAQRSSHDSPSLLITPDDQLARDLASDISTLLPDRQVRHYPARGVLYESHLAPPPHLVGLRIGASDALAATGSNAIVIASIGALA
ncbi:MAG: hypothetical protein JHC87_07615, partial [Thermoleophilaceae bacterium]|nr:hypothetical protein [Thermoleophilaceae bacterium]